MSCRGSRVYSLLDQMARAMHDLRLGSLIGRSSRFSGNPRVIRASFDGAVLGRWWSATVDEVDEAAASSGAAWLEWRDRPAYERADLLADICESMRAHERELADAMVKPIGKTIVDARAEVSRAIRTMHYSSEEAGRLAGEEVPLEGDPTGVGRFGVARRVPVGVVAAITPFNAPLNLLCHKIGPALGAGNTVVTKPHPAGSAVTLLLARLCLEAGLPAGALSVVLGGSDVGDRLVRDRRVGLVNFTGSGDVARRIVVAAGLKRTVLELGGNAPTIVHVDADLELAVESCLLASFGLSGQSCVSTQRLYVHAAVFSKFSELFLKAVDALRVGDPEDPQTQVGPLIGVSAAKRVEALIGAAVEGGAVVLCGGRRVGSLVWPTVLGHVSEDSSVSRQEVFGPVVVLTPYHNLGEAIGWSNNSEYGLKAGIFTQSLDVALRAGRELEYGTVNINGASRQRTDLEPSGGVKGSGWGLEGPRYAMREMTYLKMVTVATGARPGVEPPGRSSVAVAAAQRS